MTDIFGRGVTALMQIQSDFNTFQSGGTWYPISAYEHSDGETRGLENDPLLGRGLHNNRDPNASAPALPVGGGNVVVPLCLREHGFILTALLGSPVTTGSGPYVHTWESGKADPVYFSKSKQLKSNLFRRARGWMVNTYAVALKKESGYPRATLGAVLRDEAKATSIVTGTVASAFSLLRVPSSKPFVNYNGAAAGTTEFNFNFSNQCAPNNEFNDSEYPNGFDLGDVQLGGSFTVPYRDATWDDLADANTADDFVFGWVKDSNAHIKYTLANTRIGRSPLTINNPGKLFATYDFIPEQTDALPALKVEIKNDVTGYPPPPPPPPPPP